MKVNWPQDKFQIIYADPPWPYLNKWYGKKTGMRHITEEYLTMTFEQIYSLPVAEIADRNCLLFLWVVSPSLEEGIETGKRWGFQYRTIGFVWEKHRPSPSNYTMPSCELCLVFKRGSIPKPRGSRSERQFLSQLALVASKKPLEFRRRIDLMFPWSKKIELFARQESIGWSVWGNETGKFRPYREPVNLGL